MSLFGHEEERRQPEPSEAAPLAERLRPVGASSGYVGQEHVLAE